MAKAQFHKNQRVFVKPVGTWARVEQIIPQWTKGLDEPVRISYDVGLGREFTADELRQDKLELTDAPEIDENWRIIRANNKWQQPDQCTHHPYPGTYPVVVTGERDWGGWRVPGSEYDLDPNRSEYQARVMSSGLKLLQLVKQLVRTHSEKPDSCPDEVVALAEEAERVVATIETMQDDETSDNPNEEDTTPEIAIV